MKRVVLLFITVTTREIYFKSKSIYVLTNPGDRLRRPKATLIVNRKRQPGGCGLHKVRVCRSNAHLACDCRVEEAPVVLHSFDGCNQIGRVATS
jgi:hypothetical protein